MTSDEEFREFLKNNPELLGDYPLPEGEAPRELPKEPDPATDAALGFYVVREVRAVPVADGLMNANLQGDYVLFGWSCHKSLLANYLNLWNAYVADGDEESVHLAAGTFDMQMRLIVQTMVSALFGEHVRLQMSPIEECVRGGMHHHDEDEDGDGEELV